MRAVAYWAAATTLLCIDPLQTKNQQRWNKALQMLSTTEMARYRFDHRAKLASLVGIYMDDDCQGSPSFGVDLIVAVQPDRNAGRKLLFLDRTTGDTLGHITLETRSNDQERILSDDTGENIKKSIFRGMNIDESARGLGYSTLFLSIWLKLCLQADAIPASVSINKPLVALALVRFGFTPTTMTNATKHKMKRRRSPLSVEVTPGNEGLVCLYCADDYTGLLEGFTETELKSQRLVLLEEPADQRGKLVLIRTQYQAPEAYGDNVLYGLRLDPLEGECGTDAATFVLRDEASKALTGRLDSFRN
jgi:hypothetical protein